LSDNVVWFKELFKEDIAIAGGKGASLGEMYNAGFPIPPGFAISANAFKKFLDTGVGSDIFTILARVNVDDNEELQAASRKIKEIILSQPMPLNIRDDILEAYENLNIDDSVFETKNKKAMDLIKAGRDAPLVAVRSSATAEDLPSIGKDEFVLVKIDNEVVHTSMEKLWLIYEKDQDAKIFIPSLKNNKLEWIRASEIYKHPANGAKLIKIITKTGRHITITPQHSLLALNPETFQLDVLNSKDITKNTRVPVIKRIHLPNIKEIKEIIVSDIIKKPILIKDNRIKINSKKSSIQNDFPLKLEVDNELAYVLGLYAAEGSTYEDNCVDFSCESKELAEKVEKYFEKKCKLAKPKLGNVRIFNKVLVELLHELFGSPLANVKGKGRSARIKKVPNLIFNLNEEKIGSFLKGCFDGDGYIFEKGIQYTSVSKELLSGVIKLIEMLGIRCYLTKNHTVAIPIYEAELFKEKIGLTEDAKIKRLNTLIKNYSNRTKQYNYIDTLPPSQKISELMEKYLKKDINFDLIDVMECPFCSGIMKKGGKSSSLKQRYVCEDCNKSVSDNGNLKEKSVNKLINYDISGRFTKNAAPWNKGNRKLLQTYGLNYFNKIAQRLNSPELLEIANADVMWDPIKRVEEIEYQGDVYDFVVPGTQNFAAGVGGIITHNTASFAGQQETFLNIKGNKRLLDAVQRCWASLYTARAIYYRVKNNFDHNKVLISVIVQKMVKSDKSGVMFSVNPMNSDDSEIEIEAGFGLGEAVVSGAINPDQYIIDKNNLSLKSKKINRQEWMITLDINTGANIKKDISADKQETQKLSQFEIEKLAELAVKIEKHYTKPQDIEFAIEGSRIFVVQSRPITTLKKPYSEKEQLSKEENISNGDHAEPIVEGLPASPGVGIGPVKIIRNADELTKIEKGDVLVAEMTDPDYVSAMEKACAIVTDKGGSTSHAAIVGREMGIPVIVGTNNATKILKDNELITVDATNGKVYKGRLDLGSKKTEEASLRAESAEHFEIETATEVKVVMDLPKFAEHAAQTGADGVGLLRVEHMMLSGKAHPSFLIKSGRKAELLSDLVSGMTTIARAFQGKKVWVRLLDVPTDEFRNMEGGQDEAIEDNPMMGFRGIRRDLGEPELFKTQIEAIKQIHEAGLTNVGVMIPLVTHLDQIKQSKDLIRQCGFEPCKDIEFGIMVETPAAVQIIDEICREGINFVSFGTNDLTQYTLAIDRNNARVQNLYDEMHPAVLRQIASVIKVCKKYGVNTSICGQAGSRPEMAEFLVKCGIDSISANPDAVHTIRTVVAKAERKLLLNIARGNP